MKRSVPLLVLAMAGTAMAEDKRGLGAHEHGVGALNIAFDGATVAMELMAPGADIVGFEYAPNSDADRAAVDAAVATLAAPLDLFLLPAEAACSVTLASAELESEAGHDDHGHDDDHAEHGHDDDHADHAKDDHADEDGGHTEFHATYTLTCAKPDALTQITFAYFDRFENARELEVQVLSSKGAQAFEIDRDAPVLDLRSMF